MNSKPSTSRKTTKVGLVTSSSADKSVVVKVENLVMHPLYQKFVRTSSKFMAHDEENSCNEGDDTDDKKQVNRSLFESAAGAGRTKISARGHGLSLGSGIEALRGSERVPA